MAKAKKQRAITYEKPLKIEGRFGDVTKVAVTNFEKPKERAVENFLLYYTLGIWSK
jgi:hypothetical protein